MAKFGSEARFITMVRQCHDGMLALVQNNGEYLEPFPVTNGVKQGCVLAPSLFSMMFSAMLTDAFQEYDAVFPIRYRFDGKLFNLRRLQTKSKVQTDVPAELLYADDMAENAKTEKQIERLWNEIHKPVTTMNSKSAPKKIEVVYQPASGKPCSEPTITVNGQRQQGVDKFTYLASTSEQCTLMMRLLLESLKPL